jgi:hypothetical protein
MRAHMKFTIHSKTPKGHGKNQTTIPFQAQPATTGYTYGLYMHRYNGYGGAKEEKANERQ